MKTRKFMAGLLSVIALCACLWVNAFAEVDKPVLISHEPITEQLITMMDHNAELKQMLIDSIALAKKNNPDKGMNPAQTFGRIL